MKAPLLVFGAPFSGGSLLAQILGGHPDCAVVPMLRLGLAERVEILLEAWAMSQLPIGDGLLRAVAAWLTPERDERAIPAARDWLEAHRHLASAELLAALAEAAAPRRLVIPDAEAALRPAELARWLAMAPEAVLIQPLRHPLTHGAVWAPWLNQLLFVPPDYRNQDRTPASAAVEPQLPWWRANLMLERHWPPAQRVVLRMEDLEAAPEATLAGLLERLGLAVPDPRGLKAMLRCAQTDFAVQGPDAAPGGFEDEVRYPVWEQRLALEHNPPRLEDPLPWQDPPGVLAPEVLASARAYGYE